MAGGVSFDEEDFCKLTGYRHISGGGKKEYHNNNCTRGKRKHVVQHVIACIGYLHNLFCHPYYKAEYASEH